MVETGAKVPRAAQQKPERAAWEPSPDTQHWLGAEDHGEEQSKKVRWQPPGGRNVQGTASPAALRQEEATPYLEI